MNEAIAVSDEELIKTKPNSNMGNWFADAILDGARRIHNGRVDFALQNHGGMRLNSIAAGNITVGHIYELMPFDNSLVILQLNGEQVQSLMNRIAELGGWPISKGSGFTIMDGKATNIIIDEVAFDPDNTYYAAMSDYIADGGDGTENLSDAPRIETGITLRELLLSECKHQGNLIIDNTRRIK
jgi:2',3'-cyclic-nucleotide 2'-phosphodiesterase (5'-nucleotidase family)